MNGIEFLKRLMPQYPLPVVVVSAIGDNVFDALAAGAVDFVTKISSTNTPSGMEMFINDLIIKVKIASIAKVRNSKSLITSQQIVGKVNNNSNSIIAIGASTGGTEAIFEVVKNFPADMPGIVITQHMPPVFTNIYAKRLNNTCNMEVKEAETGDAIIPGRILIAPGDYQMVVDKRGSNFIVECFKGEKVNGHCPSVDVLFNSVAKKLNGNAIGVILTGMGYDGAKGLLNMRKSGCYTIGQDEQSSVVYGMPKVAYNINAVDRQVSLKSIPNVIYSVLGSRT